MNEQDAKRAAYLKSWFAVAGDQAAKFTNLTIPEIAIARDARSRTALFRSMVAEQENARQSRHRGR